VHGVDAMPADIKGVAAVPTPGGAQVAEEFVNKLRCLAIGSRYCWHEKSIAHFG
jgi:hypothetical protein